MSALRQGRRSTSSLCHLQEAVQEHGGSKLIPRPGIGMCHGHRCAQGQGGSDGSCSLQPQYAGRCDVFDATQEFTLDPCGPVCLSFPFSSNLGHILKKKKFYLPPRTMSRLYIFTINSKIRYYDSNSRWQSYDLLGWFISVFFLIFFYIYFE